jgi:hypothetical protein
MFACMKKKAKILLELIKIVLFFRATAWAGKNSVS